MENPDVSSPRQELWLHAPSSALPAHEETHPQQAHSPQAQQQQQPQQQQKSQQQRAQPQEEQRTQGQPACVQQQEGVRSPRSDALRYGGDPGAAAFCRPLHFFVQHAEADESNVEEDEKERSGEEGAGPEAQEKADSGAQPDTFSKSRGRGPQRARTQKQKRQQQHGGLSFVVRRNARAPPGSRSQHAPSVAEADAVAQGIAQAADAAAAAAEARATPPPAAREKASGRRATAGAAEAPAECVAAAAPTGGATTASESSSSCATNKSETAADAASRKLATGALHAEEVGRVQTINAGSSGHLDSSSYASSSNTSSSSSHSNSCGLPGAPLQEASEGLSTPPSSSRRAPASVQPQPHYSLVRFEIHPAGPYVELPEALAEDGHNNSGRFVHSSSREGGGICRRTGSTIPSSSCTGSSSSTSVSCSSRPTGSVDVLGGGSAGTASSSSNSGASADDSRGVHSDLCADGNSSLSCPCCSDPDTTSSSSTYTQKLLDVLWSEGATRRSSGTGSSGGSSSSGPGEEVDGAAGRVDACRAAAQRGLTKETTDEGTEDKGVMAKLRTEEESAAAAGDKGEAEEGGGASEDGKRLRHAGRCFAEGGDLANDMCCPALEAEQLAAASAGAGAASLRVAAAAACAAAAAATTTPDQEDVALLESLLTMEAVTPGAAARLRGLPVSQWGDTIDDMCQNDAHKFYVRNNEPTFVFSSCLAAAAACTGSERQLAAAERRTVAAAAASAAERRTPVSAGGGGEGGQGGGAQEAAEAATATAAAERRGPAAATEEEEYAEDVGSDQKRDAVIAEQYVVQQRNGLLRVGISRFHPALGAYVRRLHRPSVAVDNSSAGEGERVAGYRKIRYPPSALRRKAAADATAEEGEAQISAEHRVESTNESCGKMAATAKEEEENSVYDGLVQGEKTKHEVYYTEEERGVAPAGQRHIKMDFNPTSKNKKENYAVNTGVAQRSSPEDTSPETVLDSMIRQIRLEVRESVLKNSISGKRKKGGIFLQPRSLLAVLRYEEKGEGLDKGTRTHVMQPAVQARACALGPYEGDHGDDEAEPPLSEEARQPQQKTSQPLQLHEQSGSSNRLWKSTSKTARKRRKIQESRRKEGGVVHAQEQREQGELVKRASTAAAARCPQICASSRLEKEQSPAGQWKQRELRIYACAAGDLIEFNTALLEQPRLLFDAPEREGWVAIIRPRREWRRPPLQVQRTLSQHSL